jgi:hypothetical protein
MGLVPDGHFAIVRRVFPEESLAESATFLVSGDLESRAWIFVRSTRPPRRAPPLFGPAFAHERLARLVF